MSSGFLYPIQMRYSDEDSYQHVNNVTYLRYLEDARVRLLNTPITWSETPGVNGTSLKEHAPEGALPMVGGQRIEYLNQLTFRLDPIFVRIWVSHIGGSSYTLQYLVQEEDGSTIYAHAETGIVLVKIATGRPERLSAAMRDGLSPLIGEPVKFRRMGVA